MKKSAITVDVRNEFERLQARFQSITPNTKVVDLGLNPNKVHTCVINGEIQVRGQEVDSMRERNPKIWGVLLIGVPVLVNGKPAFMSLTKSQFEKLSEDSEKDTEDNVSFGIGQTKNVTVQSYKKDVKDSEGNVTTEDRQYLAYYDGDLEAGQDIVTTIEAVGATKEAAKAEVV